MTITKLLSNGLSGLIWRNKINEVIDETNNQWDGVKYSLLGTSITSQPDSYVSVLNSLLGSTAQNLGASGQTIVGGAIYTNIGEVSLNSHLVIFDGLVNDWRAGVTIGTLADTAPTTLHGAIYSAVTRLIEQNPLRQVVLSTPFGFTINSPTWQENNSAGNSLTQFCDAVKQAGIRLGVPVCDIATLSGIGGPTASIFMTDGIHINNPAGSTRYAKTLYQFLRQVPRGVTPTNVPTGWTMRDALLSDLSGFRATPTSLSGGNLAYTCDAPVDGAYGVIWVGNTGSSLNAIEFNSPTNPNTHIAVCSGASGAGCVGGYGGPSIAFRINTAGDITTSSLVSSFGPASLSGTRIRASLLNRTVRIEAWNGSAWVLESVSAIPLQSSITAGYRETPRLGLVVFGPTQAATFNGLKVGTYTP